MLASHADREQVIGALEAAFAAGLLAKGDYECRVDRTLASRTHADLAAVTAGITAGSSPSRPGLRQAHDAASRPGLRQAHDAASRPGLRQAQNAAVWGVCGLIVSAALTVVVMPAGPTKGVVAGTAVLIYAAGLLLAAITMIATRLR